MGLPMISLFLATILSTSVARFDVDNPIQLSRQPRNSGYGRKPEKINCQSFRVGVEAYNLRDWETVPSHCKSYIKSYVTGKQYNLDIEAMAAAAIKFANSTPIPLGLRPNVWVFDIDETLLSNLGYLKSSSVQFGTLPINYTSFFEWIESENATAPALPAILYLYKTVSSLGYKTVILSGAPELIRDKRIADLMEAGYSDWNDLILRSEAEYEMSIEEYKSKKRTELVQNKRYRIMGNVGDQWSDLLGPNAGMRTFKVPNPMYYTA